MRDKLTWYGRRLRAMDASEVVSRSRAAIAEVGDGLLEVVPGLWGVRWEPDSARLLERNPIDEPVGFMRVERAALLGARVSRETDALVARAELALDGRVQFFGYRETHVGEDSDRDPLTGRTWPNRRAKRIDYRRTDVGDPKWIWELHRCQDASRLAAAWLATRDARYGQGAGRRITTWVLHNTPGRGMAWSSGFEAALRAISFALAFDALRGSPQFVDPHLVLRSLWQHGRWIMRDPSVGSSANNHRIAELVGMLVIGCLAPELRDSTRWRRLAVAELSHEVGRQIRPDGTSAEQAFSYHVFVVDLVLLAVAVLEATKHAVPMELEAAVRRSGDALWAQLGEGESAPTYGDTDDGRAFVLDGGDLRDPRGVAAGIAARFGHAGAKYVAQDVDASVCWLFGESGIQRFDGVEAAPPPESVSLPCAGLTIIRRRGRRFIVDHGPHGHTTLAAHAHADALSVDASLGGVELVVDPGVGSYFARPAWRSAFRGTGFHPTWSSTASTAPCRAARFSGPRTHARNCFCSTSTEASS